MRTTRENLAPLLLDAGSVPLDAIARRVGDIWSDLPFDKAARTRLRSDGLSLDGLRLSGPMPYRLSLSSDGMLLVSVPDGPAAEMLIDLWRLHFARGLRQPLSPD